MNPFVFKTTKSLGRFSLSLGHTSNFPWLNVQRNLHSSTGAHGDKPLRGNSCHSPSPRPRIVAYFVELELEISRVQIEEHQPGIDTARSTLDHARANNIVDRHGTNHDPTSIHNYNSPLHPANMWEGCAPFPTNFCSMDMVMGHISQKHKLGSVPFRKWSSCNGDKENFPQIPKKKILQCIDVVYDLHAH